MHSPFPGMDPYLEDRHLWPSVHHRLISSMSDMLTAQVAPQFYVSIEERVYITGPEDIDSPLIAPDIYLVERPYLHSDARIQHHTEPIMPTVPTMVQALDMVEIRDRFIEVRDSNGQELVTTIEVLSPRNKAPNTKGRRAFLAKRRAVMSAATNWIEIDLLRNGQRPDEVAQQSDYYALLKRQGHADQFAVWFFDLRDPLPVISVPLRPTFADAVLDLKRVLTEVYARGTYALRLDYSQPVPSPALRKADLAWARERIHTSAHTAAS